MLPENFRRPWPCWPSSEYVFISCGYHNFLYYERYHSYTKVRNLDPEEIIYWNYVCLEILEISSGGSSRKKYRFNHVACKSAKLTKTTINWDLILITWIYNQTFGSFYTILSNLLFCDIPSSSILSSFGNHCLADFTHFRALYTQ